LTSIFYFDNEIENYLHNSKIKIIKAGDGQNFSAKFCPMRHPAGGIPRRISANIFIFGQKIICVITQKSYKSYLCKLKTIYYDFRSLLIYYLQYKFAKTNITPIMLNF